MHELTNKFLKLPKEVTEADVCTDLSPLGLFMVIETNFRNELNGLRIPTRRRQTCWLYTSAAEEFTLNQGLKQVQLVVGAGLELGISKFQIRRPDHSTPLPPILIKKKKDDLNDSEKLIKTRRGPKRSLNPGTLAGK